LWVREKWRIGAWDIESPNAPALAIDYFDGPRKDLIKDPRDFDGSKTCRYIRRSIDELFKKKIRPDESNKFRWTPGESPLRWRPSIHMPRWASRITLEVTRVRVERLQDITEQDAVSEGVRGLEKILAGGTDKLDPDSGYESGMILSPRFCFQNLWDWINAERPKLPKDVTSSRYATVKRWLEKHPPCTWDDNPWVWVVEFRRVEK
jgi:hypothetical protein